jgi:hypothetical protein
MGDLMLDIAAALLLASSTPVEAPLLQSLTSAETQVIERTYLKASSGQRAALAKFIVANWFELDRIAKEQGLFTHYRLSENLNAAADWDFEVAVGYPNAEGYQNSDVQARFAEIRKAHTTILIDGKGLKELGRIVRSDRIRPREEG